MYLFRRKRRENALEALSRAFQPFQAQEDHSCLENPYPWRLAAEDGALLLKPCDFCGHAIQAHTYSLPCSQCVLEEQIRQILNAVLTGLKVAR
jgi:hypothetical protein